MIIDWFYGYSAINMIGDNLEASISKRGSLDSAEGRAAVGFVGCVSAFESAEQLFGL